jgi:tetratricopeptide (TPR) repeat protein
MDTKKLRIFIPCLIVFLVWAGSACAMDLDRVKEHFLKSEWKDAIREGESLLARSGRDSSDLDQLYYYLGLCYYKDGNYLRSNDIFEIILKEFPKSRFAAPARKALKESKGRLPSEPVLKKAEQSYAKPETVPEAPEPDLILAPEPGLVLAPEPDLILAPELRKELKASSQVLFFVQVGAFSSRRNADKLARKLQIAGYSVGVAFSESKHGPVHKVRVGSFSSRDDARAAAKKLSRQGYPTKVIP